MKLNREKNISIWQNLYNEQKSITQYPDSTFITIAHRLLKPEKHKKILDYGFGTGANMLYLLKRGFNCSGVEVSENAIEITAEKIAKEAFKTDLKIIKDGIIPFDDNVFDSVVAWQVLCYNDRDTLSYAVSEINRVLSPGGVFIGTMAASGNSAFENSRSLGNGLYEYGSAATGQEGAIVMGIDDERQLENCFPGKKLNIGKMGYNFGDRHCYYWIVTYEK